MQTENNKSFPCIVFETLSRINVNKYTDKKLGMTYLSWTHAWRILLENYPESYIAEQRQEILQGGSVMVHTTITVKDGDNELSRSMWLPVMNAKNQAVVNPDARQISDTMMRCMVKCISLLGLGLYVYAGEDLPASEQEEQEELAKLYHEVQKEIAEARTLEQFNETYKSMMSLIPKLDSGRVNELAVHMKQKIKECNLVYNKETQLFELPKTDDENKEENVV